MTTDQPLRTLTASAWLAVRAHDDERHQRQDERRNDPRRPLPRLVRRDERRATSDL